LEDVSHGGGVQMAGVEEAEVMTEVEDITEMEVRIGIKGMMNDVRKKRKESITTTPAT
jgi:hypothetical protein